MNWPELGLSALWLLGLALLLAGLSLRYFFGAEQPAAGTKALRAGGIFFSLGWGLSADSLPERGIWLGAALVLGLGLLFSWFSTLRK